MTKDYQDALAFFEIQSGFVEEQIKKNRESLQKIYNPDNFAYLSPEYLLAINKQFEIRNAYLLLWKPYSHYILNQSVNSINYEQMVNEISKLIYDYGKKSKIIDKKFIVNVVEILVFFKGLEKYVKDIEFLDYDKTANASYANGTLKVYEQTLKNSIVAPYWFEQAEKTYYPYYCTVATIRHEVEHANQKKIADQEENDIHSLIWQACNAYRQTYNDSLSHILNFPSPLLEIINTLLSFKANIQDRKYKKYWMYCPEEKIAEICGNTLALNLIDRAPNKKELQNMAINFSNLLITILLFGYDKLLGPTDFYLSKLKQDKACLKLREMSKELSLEERLLLGLPVSPIELESAKKDKEKILSEIRKIC